MNEPSLRPKTRGSQIVGLLIVATASLLFFQACGKKASPEESCNFVMNSEDQRVSWGYRIPVRMFVHQTVSQQHYKAIEAAAQEWNSKLGKEVIQIVGWTDTAGVPKQDGANIIYNLSTWEPDRTREQARTTVYWSGTQIQEADIRLNDKDYDFSTLEAGESAKVDLQSLILHELGHVIGLAHTELPLAVMARSLPYAYLRRTLTDVDITSVRCEY